MTITLQGIIADIAFQNEDNGYTVLQLATDGSPRPLACVGTMPTVSKGESVILHGEWETHRKFGKQFTVERYEIVRPTTIEGIENLLGSGLITGIGPGRARIIVEQFGLASLDILDNQTNRLLEVRGIGPITFERIAQAWQRQRHIRDLMLFLQEIGVSINLATRIYKTYGDEAKERISSDPYSLPDDVWGVGFIKADRIARSMGFTHDSYKRIRAGITFVVNEAAGDGHSFLPADELIAKAADLLDVEKKLVVFSLDHSVQAELLVSENGRIFLPGYYYAEKKIAELLQAKIAAASSVKENGVSSAQVERWLADYQRTTGWRGDPKQIDAVATAVTCPIFLLTGGPGTGKTTILQVIVAFFRERHRLIALAAPTGRAAQRMGSIAGIGAQTIHRLLEFKGGADGYRFGRNDKNRIEADVIIIDEMSMIDLQLMRSLMAAVKHSSALILVGDSNQLPSVGAGNVLADLIASRVIPHVHLTTIFRQAASSRIVTAAHELIGGGIPVFTNSQSDNCFFIAESDPDRCVEIIADLVVRRLPARYGFDPTADIQVLSPMHNGLLGTRNLTARLQKDLTASGKGLARGATTFFLNDKVLQLRNNYGLGVFNGDIGIVTAINEEEGLTVDFNGSQVYYDRKDLDELTPAYCISIHKSQGSEFKAVVIPLVTQHFILLQRNLLYTALTRARQLCVIVGTRKALSIAVANNKAIERYSSLAERLAPQNAKPAVTVVGESPRE